MFILRKYLLERGAGYGFINSILNILGPLSLLYINLTYANNDELGGIPKEPGISTSGKKGEAKHRSIFGWELDEGLSSKFL